MVPFQPFGRQIAVRKRIPARPYLSGFGLVQHVPVKIINSAELSPVAAGIFYQRTFTVCRHNAHAVAFQNTRYGYGRGFAQPRRTPAENRQGSAQMQNPPGKTSENTVSVIKKPHLFNIGFIGKMIVQPVPQPERIRTLDKGANRQNQKQQRRQRRNKGSRVQLSETKSQNKNPLPFSIGGQQIFRILA